MVIPGAFVVSKVQYLTGRVRIEAAGSSETLSTLLNDIWGHFLEEKNA